MNLFSFAENAYAQMDADAFGRVAAPVFTHIIDPIIGLLFAVAVVVFAYGVFQVVWNKTDAEAYQKGKNSMIGGVIGMFIMLSAWGIVHIIANTIKGI